MLVDNDESGREKQKSLEKDLYNTEKEKILNIDEFTLKKITDAEIEDIMDAQEIEDAFNREFRYEDDFIYNSDDSNSIIKQIETFCETNNYILCEGWKVLVARRYMQKN